MSVAHRPACTSVPAELSHTAPASDMVQVDVDQQGVDTPTLDRFQLTLRDSGDRQHALSKHAVLNSTPTM